MAGAHITFRPMEPPLRAKNLSNEPCKCCVYVRWHVLQIHLRYNLYTVSALTKLLCAQSGLTSKFVPRTSKYVHSSLRLKWRWLGRDHMLLGIRIFQFRLKKTFPKKGFSMENVPNEKFSDWKRSPPNKKRREHSGVLAQAGREWGEVTPSCDSATFVNMCCPVKSVRF